jgi:cardiolipin synthase
MNYLRTTGGQKDRTDSPSPVAYGGLAVAGAAALAAAAALPALTADLLQRRGRREREAPRPGTFSATVGDSEMTVYTDGRSLYDDMIAAIDDARDIVLMQNYLWKDDDDGLAFIRALNAAAERGVEVYVIYDGFGNMVVPRSFYDNFSDKVHVARLPFASRRLWTAPLRNTGVNHSKILVVDDHTGFVGGYNIGSQFAGHWRDTHVRQVGPQPWGLRNAVARIWNEKWPDDGDIPWTAPDSWDSRVQVVANLPVQLVYPLRNMYLTAIERARDHIWITTAYFIPDQQILQALYRAADRGVDVRLMVPKESNHMIADWVSRGFYAELLERGVTLHLYAATMIHAKTATIDGEWSTVGTANIDRLSLSFNYETNVEVTDREFAATMEKVFLADIEHCETLTSASSRSWRDDHPLSRVAEIALMPLRKVL